MLRSTVTQLQYEVACARNTFSYSSIANKLHIVEHYTGLSPDMFKIVLGLCSRFGGKWIVSWGSAEKKKIITSNHEINTLN